MIRRSNSLLKVIHYFFLTKPTTFIILFEEGGDLKMEEKGNSAPDDYEGGNLEEVVTSEC